jgi:hypothetical protein
MPYIVTTRKPGETPITALPPERSRPAALAKLVEAHGPLILTYLMAGQPGFVYQFEDGTAATLKEISDDQHDPDPIPA